LAGLADFAGFFAGFFGERFGELPAAELLPFLAGFFAAGFFFAGFVAGALDFELSEVVGDCSAGDDDVSMLV
jgi:hypothetical protein